MLRIKSEIEKSRGCWPKRERNNVLITTIDVQEIINTNIPNITIRNMDITTMAILREKRADAHLIKLK